MFALRSFLCFLLLASGYPVSIDCGLWIVDYGLPPPARIVQGDRVAWRRFEYFKIQMGTRVEIILYARDEIAARRAASAAFARIQLLDETMTDYNPGSELMRLCLSADLEPQPVSLDLFRILKRAQHYSELTGGAFDVTVGPMVELWREARRRKALPDDAALQRARAPVGYRKVRLADSGRNIVLLRPGMRLDLGGIAKGYAADAAARVLQESGVHAALVAAGGDIRVISSPPNEKGWRISIQGADRESRTILLHDAAISTSGEAEQFVEIDGRRFSHIIDPRTGMALTGKSSATVIATNAAESDALATALCVLSPAEGLRIIEAGKDLAALLIRDGATYSSRRMKIYLNAKTQRQKD